MADESGAHETAAQPVSGIRQIVWVRQILQRWQSTAAASTARRSNADADANANANANCDPDSSADQRNGDTDTDDDDDKKPLLPRVMVVEKRGGGGGGCRDGGNRPDDERNPGSEPMTPDAPVDVPRGCCAVYVGAERRRFVVPTAYLGMPVFRRLLEKAEEEFGFDYRGGALTIPCDTEAFKHNLVVRTSTRRASSATKGTPRRLVDHRRIERVPHRT